jgi:hypothetical protein
MSLTDGIERPHDAACADAVLGDGGVAQACSPNTNDFGERVAIYADIFCGGM